MCLCFGIPDSLLGERQLQGSRETCHKSKMACWVQCLLSRHEALSSHPPQHPQKIMCWSHVSNPSTKDSPRARCLGILNHPCALASVRNPVSNDKIVHNPRSPLASRCTWHGHMHIFTCVCHTHTNERALRRAQYIDCARLGHMHVLVRGVGSLLPLYGI